MRRRIVAACVLVSAASLGGELRGEDTWPAVDPPAAPGSSSPALAASPSSGLLATWIEGEPGGLQQVRFARYLAGGWSPPATVAESATLFANWADTPGAAASGDGSLYAWWLEKTGADPYAYSIALARSVDAGVSWRRIGTVNDDRIAAEHGFVSMVAEGAGARVFWLDGREVPDGGSIQLRRARIEGERIEASEIVDDRVCDCCPTSAVMLGESAQVAFRDRSADEVRDLGLARSDGGTIERGEAPVDGWRIAGCPVQGPALAIAGGELWVAWFSAPADRARVAAARSADGGRSFGPAVPVDDRAPIGRVALAAAADREVVVGWLSAAEGGSAPIRLRRIAADGRLGAAVTVASTGAGRGSGMPRLERAEDGNLLLLWLDTLSEQPRLRAQRIEPSVLPAP